MSLQESKVEVELRAWEFFEFAVVRGQVTRCFIRTNYSWLPKLPPLCHSSPIRTASKDKPCLQRAPTRRFIIVDSDSTIHEAQDQQEETRPRKRQQVDEDEEEERKKEEAGSAGARLVCDPDYYKEDGNCVVSAG